MPPAAQDDFCLDLYAAQAASQSAIVPQQAKGHDNTWDIWENFCMEHAVDPLLNTVKDPIQYLMVFAVCYCDSRLAKYGQPI